MTDVSFSDVDDKEMVVTITLYGPDVDKVQVSVHEAGVPGGERTEIYTNEQQVMGIYTLMDLLMDVMEGRNFIEEEVAQNQMKDSLAGQMQQQHNVSDA